MISFGFEGMGVSSLCSMNVAKRGAGVEEVVETSIVQEGESASEWSQEEAGNDGRSCS